jgi:hypothetical protein
MIASIPLLVLSLIAFVIVLWKLRSLQRMASLQIQQNLMARQQIVKRLGIERMRKIDETLIIDEVVEGKAVSSEFDIPSDSENAKPVERKQDTLETKDVSAASPDARDSPDAP